VVTSQLSVQTSGGTIQVINGTNAFFSSVSTDILTSMQGATITVPAGQTLRIDGTLLADFTAPVLADEIDAKNVNVEFNVAAGQTLSGQFLSISNFANVANLVVPHTATLFNVNFAVAPTISKLYVGEVYSNVANGTVSLESRHLVNTELLVSNLASITGVPIIEMLKASNVAQGTISGLATVTSNIVTFSNNVRVSQTLNASTLTLERIEAGDLTINAALNMRQQPILAEGLSISLRGNNQSLLSLQQTDPNLFSTLSLQQGNSTAFSIDTSGHASGSSLAVNAATSNFSTVAHNLVANNLVSSLSASLNVAEITSAIVGQLTAVNASFNTLSVVNAFSLTGALAAQTLSGQQIQLGPEAW
jgi:hypothetical protein